METKHRFRPSLRQYRILEDAVKFYKEAIDTNNKDLCKALADKTEIAKAFHAADEYAVKMESGWDNTALWAFLLSIVAITCSAYQIAQWL